MIRLWCLYFLKLLNHKNSANLRNKKKTGSKITKNTKGIRYFQNIFLGHPEWIICVLENKTICCS